MTFHYNDHARMARKSEWFKCSIRAVRVTLVRFMREARLRVRNPALRIAIVCRTTLAFAAYDSTAFAFRPTIFPSATLTM